MSEIFVFPSGNGTAYVDAVYPYDGQTVTLTANPDPGETLDDITARESHGYAVALATTNVQSFTYDETWGDLTIYVTFSGGSPPPPPPINWLWAILATRRRPK